MTSFVFGTNGLVVAVGASLALVQCSPASASTPETAASSLYEVVRADLDVTLTENGTLVAKESQKLTFKIRGQGRITSVVPEGKEVEEDEVVCKLDTTELEKRVEELALELLTAETAFSTAKTDLEIQEAENIAKTEKTDNALIKAEKDFERYRDGDAPQERRKLEIELKDAETTFSRAKKKYADSQELLELKYIKPTELEDHQIEFEKATVSKEGAELAIKLFEKYTLPMTLTEKQIAVRDAKREAETTLKRCKSELLQKQVAVTQAEKRVETMKRNIEEKKEDIEKMTMKAPVPGIVLYGDPREPWYNERIKVGGTVWEGVTLMTIPDLRVMLVKLDIHEADIIKVQEGQKATVTMDTYPGLVLAGEVTRVAQIAATTNPWESSSGVKKFNVEVTITDTQNVKLKPGISAKAEVQIDRVKNALFVPLQCVFLESGKHYCRVLEADGPVRRGIEVGLSSDRYMQVVGGLEQGERVLLYNPDLPGEGETGPPDEPVEAAMEDPEAKAAVAESDGDAPPG